MALPEAVQQWYLGGGGFTTAQDLLPLAASVSPGALPNYDADRDNFAGLLVFKGDGLAETDRARMQRWLGVPAEPRLLGDAYLEFWGAARNFSPATNVTIDAGIYDCAGDGSDCVLLGSGGVTIDQSGIGEDFGRAVISLGSVDHTFGPGRVVLVKIAPPRESEAQAWLAYGTATYPTRLLIG